MRMTTFQQEAPDNRSLRVGYLHFALVETVGSAAK